MSNIAADYKLHDSESGRLLALSGTIGNLPSAHQKLVAEIVLLRLFYLFENIISSVASKLACGATYSDGSAPILLAPRARSSLAARVLFQNHGRTKPRILKWSQASEIKNNVKHIIDVNDNFGTVIDSHGVLIDDMRRVRNRIAHNNAQSRKNYREVVRKHYGAYMNHVTPGLLLLTPRITPRLLEQYIRQERILVKSTLKAT